jgi:hypothetical protein
LDPPAQFAGIMFQKIWAFMKIIELINIIPGGPKIFIIRYACKDRLFCIDVASNAIRLKSRGSKIVNISQV